MTLTTSKLKSFTAGTLAAALVVLSPGYAGTQAFAQVITGAVGRTVPVVPSGAVGAVRVAPLSSSLNAPVLTMPGALPSLPSALPTLRPMSVAAPSVIAPAAAPSVLPAVAPRAASAVQAAVSAVLPGREAPAAAHTPGAPSLKNLISDPRAVALPTAQLEAMPTGQAREAGAGMMDAILGLKTRGASSAQAVPVGTSFGAGRAVLSAPAASLRSPVAPVNAVAIKPQGLGATAVGVAKSAAVMAASGGLVYAAHLAAAAFLPSVFGMVPLAAVWAVSSGVLLLPISLYSRIRMGIRDSSRLTGVKLAYDAFLGAFIGALAVAVPTVLTGAILSTPMVGLAALGGLAMAGALATKGEGATGGIFSAIAAWGALNLLGPLLGTAAAAPLTLGGIFGLLALPAMTTMAFFLGRIIHAAETGRPFAVPGSVQQIRFPAYTWVMTGVVFALLTGYSAVWTNVAFGLWMFLGNTRLFNMLYAGAFAWAAFTGFAAPVTFLVIAFAPERAAMLTEKLLGKLLPKGEPAPSTRAAAPKLAVEGEARWPRFNYWLKTGLAIGSLVALGTVMSATVFGFTTFAVNLGIAGAMSLIPLVFSKKIIKAVMKAEPMDERQDPEVFTIMRELRERINAERAAKGQKPIPMPEMVNVPMPVPNAFATGISPNRAMVGVTNEMKDMTLNPERTRAALIRLMYAADPNTKQFLVFRRAIRGSIPGISETAGPQEIVQALQKADRAHVKALGVRALRGVMGHEFEHVMHRDMLLGSLAGTLTSGISFASYGVLWAVGHAQALFARVWAWMTGKDKAGKASETPSYRGPRGSVRPEASFEPIRPQAVEPVSTAVAAQSLLGLVKIFAALWGPVLATILSMASSRTREGHADEGGAILTEDPESLALGLGMLVTWQMPAGFTLRKELLPIVASQAHVMTVNPLEQLRNAGQLPKLDALTRALVGKEDDFFFNLFITHPDTMMRIERLYEMAEALAAKRRGR